MKREQNDDRSVATENREIIFDAKAPRSVLNYPFTAILLMVCRVNLHIAQKKRKKSNTQTYGGTFEPLK